jgi:hypothetical protein
MPSPVAFSRRARAASLIETPSWAESIPSAWYTTGERYKSVTGISWFTGPPGRQSPRRVRERKTAWSGPSVRTLSSAGRHRPYPVRDTRLLRTRACAGGIGSAACQSRRPSESSKVARRESCPLPRRHSHSSDGAAGRALRVDGCWPGRASSCGSVSHGATSTSFKFVCCEEEISISRACPASRAYHSMSMPSACPIRSRESTARRRLTTWSAL